jgi:hypothetical protein
VSEIVHVLYLTQDFLTGTFSFECSCGLEGWERDSEADALADWEDHCDRVGVEVTP